MASSMYKSTTLPESRHSFPKSGDEHQHYQFVFQEISFGGINKQTRASLTSPEYGGKYIYTVAMDDVWENAHFHGNQSETYILESGEAVLVLMTNGEACPQRLVAGAAVTLPAGTHHKVWMKKGAKLHAVKAAAQTAENERFRESSELEELCDAVGLEKLLANCAKNPSDGRSVI